MLTLPTRALISCWALARTFLLVVLVMMMNLCWIFLHWVFISVKYVPPFTLYSHNLLIAPQDSSHATQITLSQILDVYLALSHNAQLESVEPLYCYLSSRVSLASQHAYLLSAAEQGKT